MGGINAPPSHAELLKGEVPCELHRLAPGRQGGLEAAQPLTRSFHRVRFLYNSMSSTFINSMGFNSMSSTFTNSMDSTVANSMDSTFTSVPNFSFTYLMGFSLASSSSRISSSQPLSSA